MEESDEEEDKVDKDGTLASGDGGTSGGGASAGPKVSPGGGKSKSKIRVEGERDGGENEEKEFSLHSRKKSAKDDDLELVEYESAPPGGKKKAGSKEKAAAAKEKGDTSKEDGDHGEDGPPPGVTGSPGWPPTDKTAKQSSPELHKALKDSQALALEEEAIFEQREVGVWWNLCYGHFTDH